MLYSPFSITITFWADFILIFLFGVILNSWPFMDSSCPISHGDDGEGDSDAQIMLSS